MFDASLCETRQDLEQSRRARGVDHNFQLVVADRFLLPDGAEFQGEQLGDHGAAHLFEHRVRILVLAQQRLSSNPERADTELTRARHELDMDSTQNRHKFETNSRQTRHELDTTLTWIRHQINMCATYM